MTQSARRPSYETGGDRANEEAVAMAVCKAFNCEFRKLPKAYELDYALVRSGKVGAFMEVKDRPRYGWSEIDRLGGYMLSMHKWRAAIAMGGASRKPFILAVKANGELRLMICRSAADWVCDGVIFGGRADRGDWQDQEPCALFRVERFKVGSWT